MYADLHDQHYKDERNSSKQRKAQNEGDDVIYMGGGKAKEKQDPAVEVPKDQETLYNEFDATYKFLIDEMKKNNPEKYKRLFGDDELN